MWRYATRRASKQKRRLLRFPGYYQYSNEIAVDLGRDYCKTYTKSTCSHRHHKYTLQTPSVYITDTISLHYRHQQSTLQTPADSLQTPAVYITDTSRQPTLQTPADSLHYRHQQTAYITDTISLHYRHQQIVYITDTSR